MRDNKKIVIMIIGIIGLVCLIIGVSYAYWKSVTSQESSNAIESTCLKLEIKDSTNAINLSSAYPMSDNEAKKLTPYEFEVRNTCNTNAEFSINLDVLNVGDRLNTNYIAINFNDMGKEILGTKTKVDPIYKGDDYTAIEAYNLGSDELKAGESKIYTLKLWLDSSVETSDSMNKQFLSKISLSAETAKYAVDYLKNLAKTSAELISDGTEDYNLRYIGVDPNNYVSFNGELWRIIGVMNNIKDSSGQLATRIKLIRNESIGDFAFDNKANGTGSSISDYGSNDWSDSALMKVLNEGAYYNRTSGNCPYSASGGTTPCDFSSTGLSNEAKNMISNVVWNLSGTQEFSTATPNIFYNAERRGTVYNGRSKEWIGKVGLMYPSDYGYATIGGATMNRDKCLNVELFNWHTGDNLECRDNDWIYQTAIAQWTLTPTPAAGDFTAASYYLNPSGNINGYFVTSTYGTRPVIYLNSIVKIQNGTGTSTDPYILGM